MARRLRTVFKQFCVAAVSQNPNSFGLYGHVLVARDGEAWEVGRSHGNWLGSEWVKGAVIEVPCTVRRDGTKTPEWARLSCEIPRRLPDAPSMVIGEVWQEVTV